MNSEWITASACAAGTCVQVAFDDAGVRVRDSKDGIAGPILSFTRDEWAAFLTGVRSGEFDLLPREVTGDRYTWEYGYRRPGPVCGAAASPGPGTPLCYLAPGHPGDHTGWWETRRVTWARHPEQARA